MVKGEGEIEEQSTTNDAEALIITQLKQPPQTINITTNKNKIHNIQNHDDDELICCCCSIKFGIDICNVLLIIIGILHLIMVSTSDIMVNVILACVCMIGCIISGIINIIGMRKNNYKLMNITQKWLIINIMINIGWIILIAIKAKNSWCNCDPKEDNDDDDIGGVICALCVFYYFLFAGYLFFQIVLFGNFISILNKYIKHIKSNNYQMNPSWYDYDTDTIIQTKIMA